jgi:hypothetical protein
MKQKIKEILKNSFYQLLIIYTALIVLITMGLFWKFTIHMEIFALILGILGIFISSDKNNPDLIKDKTVHYSILAIGLILIFIIRAIPYMNNSIPLGYDTGIYKYAIEFGLQNTDKWILTGVEPGFLYLMSVFKIFLSTQFILTYLFIIFNVILGFSIYLVSKEYFNKNVALIALFIYAFSIIQFKVFELMYYKNVIALSLFLFAIYFLNKQKRVPFVICGIILGSIHRPTFYLFGLSYFIYSFINPINFQTKKYNFKELSINIISGAIIIVGVSLFYFGQFSLAITSMISPVVSGFVEPGQSPGTFIDFFTYQFTTLAYLPFAVIGFFWLIKKKQFNMVFLWALISTIIVYFQFFFFNRFIIFMDISLIILSAYGFSIIINDKKKIGIAILSILLLTLAFSSFSYSINSKPLINNDELSAISYFHNIPSSAFAMSTSSYYSTWLQGYSGRRVIAPGLFDYDVHTQSQWNEFWTSTNINTTKSFLDDYNKELYIFIGQKQRDNLNQFKDKCLSLVYNQNGNKIYKYQC